ALLGAQVVLGLVSWQLRHALDASPFAGMSAQAWLDVKVLLVSLHVVLGALVLAASAGLALAIARDIRPLAARREERSPALARAALAGGSPRAPPPRPPPPRPSKRRRPPGSRPPARTQRRATTPRSSVRRSPRSSSSRSRSPPSSRPAERRRSGCSSTLSSAR